MEDRNIIELYWMRDESAIAETQKKYGRYCYSIAHNILPQHEDAEECVNDTYFAAWNAIPPGRPNLFSAFLGKLTRHISIDKWRRQSAGKRGGSTVSIALEELTQCVPDRCDVTAQAEAKELAALINRFLKRVSEQERNVFLKRYFYLSGIDKISAEFKMSPSKVKSMLFRTRKKLRVFLEREGY